MKTTKRLFARVTLSVVTFGSFPLYAAIAQGSVESVEGPMASEVMVEQLPEGLWQHIPKMVVDAGAAALNTSPLGTTPPMLEGEPAIPPATKTLGSAPPEMPAQAPAPEMAVVENKPAAMTAVQSPPAEQPMAMKPVAESPKPRLELSTKTSGSSPSTQPTYRQRPEKRFGGLTVKEIRQARALRLANQRAEQLELNRRLGRTPLRPVAGYGSGYSGYGDSGHQTIIIPVYIR